METQLASLSSLVHSALMSKGISDTVYKDIEMLRREILGSAYHPSASGSGLRTPDLETTSDAGSISRFSGQCFPNSLLVRTALVLRLASDLSSDKGSSFQADRGTVTYD